MHELSLIQMLLSTFLKKKKLILPGMYPRIVKRILIHKSAPIPRSISTPIGGRMIAKITLQISGQVKGISLFCSVYRNIFYLKALFTMSSGSIKS